jgi:long-chain fatty acid transport protein
MAMKKFLFLTLLFPSLAFASALSKPVLIGPKAIGMGGAFVAVADDPTAIFHNPAGITQMRGHQFHLGMDSLITQEDYSPAPGVKESAKQEFLPVPTFGYVTDAADYVSLGLGVYFPHGNGGKYESPSANPVNPNEGRIYSMEIAPAVAVQIVPEFSVGATLRVVRISSSLKGGLFVFPGGTIDTLNDLDLSGWALGASAGFLLKPTPWLSVGGNYRSKVSKTLDGTATFAAAGTTPISLSKQTLPTLMTVGFAVKPSEKYTLAASYDFERNSEIEVITASLPSGLTLPIPYNYKNSHTIHFGGEAWIWPELAVRAGYAKDLNDSIPDAAMNRIIGDIAAHELSFGLAYKWSRYQVGATWNARFGSRTIPVDAANPAQVAGTYQAFVQSVSFGVGVSL